MKLRILIVEDEEPIADLIESAIQQALHGMNHQCDFRRCTSIRESVEPLRDYRPHVVTLDLKDNALDDALAGRPAWEVIRDEHFCPVVFFSANPLPEGFPDGSDPFAKYLNKTEKDASHVAATVGEFVPHIQGLQDIRSDFESRYAKSLQSVSRLIWEAESDPEIRHQAFIRVTRRRLAAALEYPLADELHVKAWEQFIYPPIDPDLCTGDVLLRSGGDAKNESDYRVILSPPCDLVSGTGRRPVIEVLLACCLSVKDPEVLRKAKISAGTNATKLGKTLQKDDIDGMLVVPMLAGVWPAMVLDFKRLELVRFDKISASNDRRIDGSQFIRVASMDSPFREALSWRFTHTIGRPGLPEMDRDSLGHDIRKVAEANR